MDLPACIDQTSTAVAAPERPWTDDELLGSSVSKRDVVEWLRANASSAFVRRNRLAGKIKVRAWWYRLFRRVRRWKRAGARRERGVDQFDLWRMRAHSFQRDPQRDRANLIHRWPAVLLRTATRTC